MVTTDPSTTILDTIRQQTVDKEMFQRVVRYAFDYLDTVDDRSIFPTDDAIATLHSTFPHDEAVPGQCHDNPTELIEMLHTCGSPASVASGSGRYFGFVTGGVIPTSLAARWLADVWDQNAGRYIMSPIASHLEHISERWIVDLIRNADLDAKIDSEEGCVVQSKQRCF